jgi:phosphoribosylaminoimidazolecarboxamide formyltransferase / IMP cyclohydrolase
LKYPTGFPGKMNIKSKNIASPEKVKIARALISVSDKSDLAAFANALAAYGIAIISTGGTKKHLQDEGLPVTDISQITDFPEIMDGRVKTLHPAVHGGLLAIRDDHEHVHAMQEHDIAPIDLLIVNLYPFEKVSQAEVTDAEIIENIDIGGPAMIRAAAKNHAYVTVLTDPGDYAELLTELTANDGYISREFRRAMAARAFARTAAYDAAIAQWFSGRVMDSPHHHIAFAGKLGAQLRYGENPHQKAAVYLTAEKRPGVATARQIQGKQLSYNNINDTDAAFELISEFDPQQHAAVAIIKHANPCGVAIAGDCATAYQRALQCDPVSAFGGIIALNRTLDAETAKLITETFSEVIIAPAVSQQAAEIIATKKNLRLLETGTIADPDFPGTVVKAISGGLLVQSRDNGRIAQSDLRIVTRRAPDEKEMADLLFAFTIAKHVKSNAIVYARNGATSGIGAGQMSRVDSARIAALKAENAAMLAGSDTPATQGSVVASDAFFPFADGLLSAIEAGASAVIQPGGSVRDEEVIAAANEAGIAMVFTGMRHFRH